MQTSLGIKEKVVAQIWLITGSSRGNVAGPTYGIYTHARIQGPYLAMTFDDGPSAEYTPRLLDLLKARHLKATFFLIGQNVQAHPELVRRIIAEGHEVGNHTWDHPQLSKLSDERATDEIEKTQDAIRTACGSHRCCCGLLMVRLTNLNMFGSRNGLSSMSFTGRWTPWIGNILELRRSPSGCSQGHALVPSSCNTIFTGRRSMPWPPRLMASSQKATT
jgi:peptidoglycan/xylan/chitin deacetylase (PgdA/CDA1 family)